MMAKTIRRTACALLLVVLGGGAVPPAVGAPSPVAGEGRVLSPEAQQALLDRLERLHTSTRTFQAAFEETRRLSTLPSPLRFEGRVYYDRDGLFFMEYLEPFRYILRVEGREALIWVEGSGTADVSRLSEAEGLDQVDVFSWDPSRFEGAVREEPGGYRLVPSERNAQAPAVSVLLDRGTLVMKRVRIQGEAGDVTELSFFDVQVNEPLPDRVTGFRLPPGVERHRMDLP